MAEYGEWNRKGATLKWLLLIPCLLLSGVSLGQVSEENAGVRIEPQPNQSVKPESSPDLAEAAADIVKRTNDFRRDQDRETLDVNPKLEETARYFADFMARTDRYGHRADGKSPAERASHHGYDFCMISENIAYQFSSAGFATEELVKTAVEGWKQSPGHRKNMLDPAVTEIGVALAYGEQSGNYYAVQMFGRPQSMTIEFKVANNADVTVDYRIGDQTFPLPPRAIRTHRQCRASELSFQGPGGQGSKTVQPNDGDRYSIERDDAGQLRLDAE
jgi:uncharacterized protein YkwD